MKEKAAYFAQYLYNPFEMEIYDGCINPDRKLITGSDIDSVNNGFRGKIYLILKPLSSITDEDAMKCSELECWNFNSEQSRNMVLNSVLYHRGALNVGTFDFLRSKGYALPFRNYSVEQLIEMGWLTLTNN